MCHRPSINGMKNTPRIYPRCLETSDCSCSPPPLISTINDTEISHFPNPSTLVGSVNLPEAHRVSAERAPHLVSSAKKFANFHNRAQPKAPPLLLPLLPLLQFHRPSNSVAPRVRGDDMESVRMRIRGVNVVLS